MHNAHADLNLKLLYYGTCTNLYLRALYCRTELYWRQIWKGIQMPQPYSEDLRWSAVWLACVRGMSCSEIANTLFMCEKSVHRYLSLFYTTRCVAAKKPNGGPSRKLNDFEQFIILQSLIYWPTAYLHEVREDLFKATGIHVSPSTICRTIKEHGFTRKKVQLIAQQRSEEKRIEFMAEISMFNPDAFIWIDETGTDRRKCVRNYGYALQGIPPRRLQLSVGGKRVSAIPVLTTRVIKDVYVTTGNVNRETFLEFFCSYVLTV